MNKKGCFKIAFVAAFLFIGNCLLVIIRPLHDVYHAFWVREPRQAVPAVHLRVRGLS